MTYGRPHSASLLSSFIHLSSGCDHPGLDMGTGPTVSCEQVTQQLITTVMNASQEAQAALWRRERRLGGTEGQGWRLIRTSVLGNSPLAGTSCCVRAS